MLTWKRAPVPRTCGYCVPQREIGIGEWYLLVETIARQHVRCRECATTHWELEAPAEADEPVVQRRPPPEPLPDLPTAAEPFDWKQRAAQDEPE